MTLATNLFIDTPEMHDVSMHQLSNDMDSWPEEIVEKLKESIPDTSGLSIMVKFMKKDEENGSATGSVLISSPTKKAIVPIIVKDFSMYPMDIMIAESKLLPLTPDYFKAVFSSNEVFQKLEEFPIYAGAGRFEDSNLWNAIYPPSLGRYSYASAGYPMLEYIGNTIDGTSLKNELAKSEKVAAMFERNGHKEIVEKLANLKAVNMNEYRQATDKLLPRNIAMLKLDGPNKYSILSTPKDMFHPMIDLPDWDGMATLSDRVKDAINEVDQNGEKLLKLPQPKNEVILAQEEREVPEMADSFDHYSIKGKTGVAFEGVVIPKVIDFEQNLVDLKVFIGKNMSSIQKDFCGVRIENSRFEMPVQDPKMGQTGVFVYQPSPSHALCTVPVTIETVLQRGEGLYQIKAMTLMGLPIRIKTGNRELKKIAKVDNCYCLPHKMQWVPMEVFESLTDSPESYSVKTASERLTTRPVSLIHTGFGQYAMKGVDKYASVAGWDPTNLERYQAKFILAALGSGEEKLAKAFEIANKFGRADIHGLDFIPTKQEKIAKFTPLAIAMDKKASELRCNLIKEASYMDNSQSVDAMLSLNFINPENISKFVSKVPLFKSTISQLASCILASRLGMKEIPEMAASTAMRKIIEVVDGLEGLKTSQEVGAG